MIGLVLFLLIITPDYAFDSLIQTYLPKDNRTKYRATDKISCHRSISQYLISIFSIDNFSLFGWKRYDFNSVFILRFYVAIKSCSIITLCGPY